MSIEPELQVAKDNSAARSAGDTRRLESAIWRCTASGAACGDASEPDGKGLFADGWDPIIRVAVIGTLSYIAVVALPD